MAQRLAGRAATAREDESVQEENTDRVVGDAQVRSSPAAMVVLTNSSTKATDCLDVEGEMYCLLHLGCIAYWIANKSMYRTERGVNVEEGCCNTDAQTAAVPPNKVAGPTLWRQESA